VCTRRTQQEALSSDRKTQLANAAASQEQLQEALERAREMAQARKTELDQLRQHVGAVQAQLGGRAAADGHDVASATDEDNVLVVDAGPGHNTHIRHSAARIRNELDAFDAELQTTTHAMCVSPSIPLHSDASTMGYAHVCVCGACSMAALPKSEDERAAVLQSLHALLSALSGASAIVVCEVWPWCSRDKFAESCDNVQEQHERRLALLATRVARLAPLLQHNAAAVQLELETARQRSCVPWRELLCHRKIVNFVSSATHSFF